MKKLVLSALLLTSALTVVASAPAAAPTTPPAAGASVTPTTPPAAGAPADKAPVASEGYLTSAWNAACAIPTSALATFDEQVAAHPRLAFLATVIATVVAVKVAEAYQAEAEENEEASL